MKKGITVILILIFFISSIISEEINLEDLLEKSEKAFQLGLDSEKDKPLDAKKYYSESVMYIEKIIKDGHIRNARLYMNLANAYYKLSEPGKALVNYKRALLFRPYDHKILSSYKYVKSTVQEVFPESDFNKIFRMFFFMHYKLPYHYKIILFSLFHVLLWIMLFMYYFMRKKIFTRMAAMFSVLFLFFMVSFFYEHYSIRNEGVVIRDTTARKGGSMAYLPSFSEPLIAGTEFRFIEKRNDWLYIKLENNDTCWIKTDSCELVFSEF